MVGPVSDEAEVTPSRFLLEGWTFVHLLIQAPMLFSGIPACSSSTPSYPRERLCNSDRFHSCGLVRDQTPLPLLWEIPVPLHSPSLCSWQPPQLTPKLKKENNPGYDADLPNTLQAEQVVCGSQRGFRFSQYNIANMVCQGQGMILRWGNLWRNGT